MKKIISLVLMIMCFSFIVGLFYVSYSQIQISADPTILPEKPEVIGEFDLGDLVNTTIQTLFYAGQIIFIVILLIGGIQYLTSMGEEGKMTSARKTIFAGLIGIVIIFSTWAIAQFVISLLS